jgi:hypothetical protein
VTQVVAITPNPVALESRCTPPSLITRERSVAAIVGARLADRLRSIEQERSDGD